MKDTFSKHTRGVTKRQADSMADCVKTEAKACMSAKMGPLAAMLGLDKVNIDMNMIETMKECAQETMQPYGEELKDCVQRDHPDADIDGMMAEFKAHMKNARNDPEVQVAFLSVMIIKMNEKMNCGAQLESCSNRANIDLQQLRADVCAAKDTCNRLSQSCKDKMAAIKASACECVDEVKASMKSDGVDVLDEIKECAADKGVQMPNIPPALKRMMEKRGGGGDMIKKQICGEDSMDGTMGMCSASNGQGNNQGQPPRRRGPFFQRRG
jgi:hypothetical protein